MQKIEITAKQSEDLFKGTNFGPGGQTHEGRVALMVNCVLQSFAGYSAGSTITQICTEAGLLENWNKPSRAGARWAYHQAFSNGRALEPACGRTLKDVGKEAHEINIGNGWDTFRPEDWPVNGDHNVLKLCTHMALVHSEVSEATEAVRHRDAENFDEELADVVIRVASIAYGLGIDLDAVINAKLSKNRTRGQHHGGKAV